MQLELPHVPRKSIFPKFFRWWSNKRQLTKDSSDKEQKRSKKIKNNNQGNEEDDSLRDEKETSNSRYILFIGNLSYECMEDDLRNHFGVIGDLKDVRILTKKGTGKSKGCAFLEFNSRIIQMKALKLHHSILCGRKINVELTCGGGGKGDKRTGKLKSKIDKMKEKRKKTKLRKKTLKTELASDT